MSYATAPKSRLAAVCASVLFATMLLSVHTTVVEAENKKSAQKHGAVSTTPHKTKASYYDDSFQGKKTASGEKFDQGEKTAASKTLPLGSKVEVKNPKTGKETTVVVNDRGPYAKGRSLDLSKSAAREIGIDKKEGVGTVEVEVVATPTPKK